MYEIPESEIQDYRQKWLEAERDLAINWVVPPLDSLNCEPIDNVDKDTEKHVEPPVPALRKKKSVDLPTKEK